MAEKDSLNPIEKMVRVMSSLRAMTEPKGVYASQSVTKDDDRERDRLTSSEQNRLKESATIIGKILEIGAYEKKAESKKNTEEGEAKKSKPGSDLLTSPLKKPKVLETVVKDKMAPEPKKSVDLAKTVVKDKMAPEPKKSVDLAKTVIKEKIKEAKVTKPISQYNSLSPSEINRYKEIATIIGNVLKIGKFKEGVEAKRLSIISSTKSQPQPSTKTMAVVKYKTSGKESSERSWLDWLNTIKKLAGAAGLGALLWKLLPGEWKEKIKGWWDDALTWILGEEGKKKLYGMWDSLWNSLFSRDKKDKGIISKWWDDMIKSFLTDEDSKKAAGDKASNWFDSLWNSAFDKESKTKNRFLTYWDNIFSLDEGTELNLIQKAALVFSRIIQGSIDITQKSWESSGAAGKTQVAVAATGAVARGVQAVLPTGKPKPPPSSIAAPTVNRGEARTIAKQKEFTSGVRKDGTRWYKKGNDFISEKDVPKSVVKRLTNPSTAGKAVQKGVQGLMSAKDLIAGGADKIKSFWNILKKIGSTAKGLAGITKWLLRIPVLASLIEYADYKMYKSEQEKLYGEKKITLDELQQRVGDKLVDGVGGAIGATLGSSIGLGLGTTLGAAAAATVVLAPIAPFVPFLGAIAGSAAGDYLGRYLADLVINKENAKTIGSSVLEKGQVVGPELQDFLVKGNNVYRFNNKDEVLGMKTGGAIDNLMTELTQGLAKDNNVIKEASIAQVNKLDELIYLMTELIKKPTQGSTNITNLAGNNVSTSFKSFNIRDQFANQTLIPVTTQPI